MKTQSICLLLALAALGCRQAERTWEYKLFAADLVESNPTGCYLVAGERIRNLPYLFAAMEREGWEFPAGRFGTNDWLVFRRPHSSAPKTAVAWRGFWHEEWGPLPPDHTNDYEVVKGAEPDLAEFLKRLQKIK